MFTYLLKQPIVRIAFFVVAAAVAVQVMPELLLLVVGFVLGANARCRRLVTRTFRKVTALA